MIRWFSLLISFTKYSKYLQNVLNNKSIHGWCILGCLVWPDQLGRESSTVQIFVYTCLDTTHLYVVLVHGNLYYFVGLTDPGE